MKIGNYAVGMQANRYHNQTIQRREKLTLAEASEKATPQGRDLRNEKGSENGRAHKRDFLELHKELTEKSQKEAKLGETEGLKKDEFSEEFISETKIRVMKQIIEAITGKKIKTYEEEKKASEEVPAENSEESPVEVVEGEENGLQNMTLTYEFHEMVYEKEAVAFAATGNITTEDGREINFETKLEMSRERFEERSGSLSITGDMIDPLTLNFDRQGVALSNETTSFDLDGDGENEEIAKLASGNYFLALDKNGDGKINDGSELFGPQSGDGFADLAAYDDDKNGWIDENDSVFYELSLWRPEDEGRGKTLLSKDVGAIYLNSVTAEFALTNSEQVVAGQVREHGLYLKESTGEAGFVQEIDLSA